MALIEIDGLPKLKMVDLSMAMLNNQMVSDYDYWRSTPLSNKPWFINPGLTLNIIKYDITCTLW
jgi:hypothetical protein